MTSRSGNHWRVSTARAGCWATVVMPNSSRPASNTANTGAQLCTKRQRVPPASVANVNHLGDIREPAHPIGTAKMIGAQ